MNHDQTFRIVLNVGALIVVPIMAYHRVKSQATGEKLDRWQEGRFMLFTLRPVGLITMLGLVAFMIQSVMDGLVSLCVYPNGCGGREWVWESLAEC